MYGVGSKNPIQGVKDAGFASLYFTMLLHSELPTGHKYAANKVKTLG